MSPAKIEAERQRKQNASIIRHYRAIGPASLVAALLHMKKAPVATRKPKAA
ncbi:MAG: transcriptional regulator [Rhizobiales bacterium]|nr:transcriptional regulator [Hyphomicrobiales bacterium]